MVMWMAAFQASMEDCCPTAAVMALLLLVMTLACAGTTANGMEMNLPAKVC